MNTLIIDTSHSLLVVGLAVDNTLVDSYQEVVEKRHSEFLLSKIDEILGNHQLSPADIDRVVVTDGPGSYTGMRIGIAFVKVLALTRPTIQVYTVDTLASLTGKQNRFALIDARSKRFFGAHIIDGNVQDERVYSIEEIKNMSTDLFGDKHMIYDEERHYEDVCQNIIDLKSTWKLVENVDVLVPRYLK